MFLHIQQVVNSDEVKQSKIIKNTVQRKNPIVQQKINQVSKQGRTRSRTSTFDKLGVVPSVTQSQDPQDCAKHEARIRQRSNRQRSISLTSTSRFLRSSTSTKRSMCQRCYKGEFQQPKPFTENSGDASEACAAHRHSTMQVQHIDKVRDVLQAQLIDEAVEVHEIMQRHDPKIQKVEDAQQTW